MKSKIIMMIILLAGIGLSAFLMTGCTDDIASQSDDDAGIVNGKMLSSRSQLSKSVVAVVAMSAEGQGLCTGTLIDEATVLTAAHCVERSPERIAIVFSQAVSEATKETLREASGFAQNPKWKKPTTKGHGDLALVHFDGGLPKGFKPVELAEKDLSLDEGLDVTLIGYGVTDGLSHEGSGKLRITKTKIEGKVSPTEIVTDGQKSSVCFGDSGGPAFSANAKGKLVQWGVASSVTNDACNEASIHTSVVSYLSWIHSTAQKLDKNPKGRGHPVELMTTNDETED